MAMTMLWAGMMVLSLACALATGQVSALAAGAVEGARSAVELCLSMAGGLCLWSGVMELMSRSGLLGRLKGLLRWPLGLLYPEHRRDEETMEALAANTAANLLGLGNAATPLGIRAAERMARKSPGVASDSLCMLVVCNTASIQLLPTTVAAVRQGLGCETPFDILPAVWLSSAVALLVGITVAKLLGRIWRWREGAGR